MKILIITELYPDDSPVKTTNAVHDLARFWTDEHEVVCVKEEWLTLSLSKEKRLRGMKPEIYRKQLASLFGWHDTERDGIAVYRFTNIADPFPHMVYDGIRNLIGRISAYKINRRLRKLCFQPDVIVAHMPLAETVHYISDLKPDCPRIAVIHSSDLDRLDETFYKKELVEKNLKLLSGEFSAVFARSYSLLRRLEEKKPGNLRQEIVFSGVPIESEYRERTWDEWPGRVRILYAGDLIERKGVHTVLCSLSHLEKDHLFEFVIIGEGRERKRLEEMIRGLSLEKYTEFKGFLPRSEVYRYMSRSDIFVMPSRHETLGLVYLEAMSNGCITIGAENEGIDGIIRHGVNGFLVEAFNEKALTELFEKIWNMEKEEICRISSYARKTAEQYTQKNMGKQYLDLIENVACNRESGAS